MGIFSTKEQNNFYLDNLSKDELVEYLSKLEIKKHDLSNFQNLVDDIELENTKLIPMMLEYYSKLKEKVPINIYNPNKNIDVFKLMKKKNRTLPRFSQEQLVKQDRQLDFLNEDLNLYDVEQPIFPFKTGNISIFEYMEAFKNPENTISLCGISKKMLQCSPTYHKTRIINCYNKLYSGMWDDSISFGRTTYEYKGKGPKNNIKSFREIMLIPASINHFHRILALRLYNYLDKNNYIDTNIQKGGIRGLKYGLAEQIIKVRESIKDANTNKKKLFVLFLDVSNAFGSLNRKRLTEILKKYYVDENIINYINKYYDELEFYSKTNEWTSNLIKWKDGLIQGCPLSQILFVTSLNYILKYLDNKFKNTMGYQINDCTKILFNAFVDDISILSDNIDHLQEVYNNLKFLLSCLGLSINESKSGILKVNSKTTKNIDNIPYVSVKKYLGEYLSDDGSNITNFKEFLKILNRKLYILDKEKVDNRTRVEFFAKIMVPVIQKKVAIMYDLTINDYKKILFLVQKYLAKWDNTENYAIFAFAINILTNSDDNVIKTANFQNNINFNLQNDINLANYYTENNITFSYDDTKSDI